jgi:hypothetical protein
MTQQTGAQILAAFAAAGHEYAEIDDLVFTYESLEDFRVSATMWAECAEVSNETYLGFDAVEFGGVQVARGHKRHGLTVIDFGNIRASYK